MGAREAEEIGKTEEKPIGWCRRAESLHEISLCLLICLNDSRNWKQNVLH